MPGRHTKEKGKEGGGVEEDGEARRIRGPIVQEVVASTKEKVSVHDGEKDDVKRPAEQSFMRSWDCSHIENEKRRKVGEKQTKWWHSGMKSKNWMRLWNKEGLKETS